METRKDFITVAGNGISERNCRRSITISRAKQACKRKGGKGGGANGAAVTGASA